MPFCALTVCTPSRLISYLTIAGEAGRATARAPPSGMDGGRSVRRFRGHRLTGLRGCHSQTGMDGIPIRVTLWVWVLTPNCSFPPPFLGIVTNVKANI